MPAGRSPTGALVGLTVLVAAVHLLLLGFGPAIDLAPRPPAPGAAAAAVAHLAAVD
ncbi:MAG: hypothetical protein RIQ53_617, partial [Pseudomonadota bacterium]